MEQLNNIAQLPFIRKHVSAMPDLHTGIGATFASVIPAHREITEFNRDAAPF